MNDQLPRPPQSTPLGLPAGSIRALLALMVMSMLWLLLLLPDQVKVPIPLALHLQVFFVLFLFVTQTRKSVMHNDEQEMLPLYLPAVIWRVFIVGVSVAIGVFLYNHHADRTVERLSIKDYADSWLPLMGSLLGGFAFGYLLRAIPGRNNWVFQGFQAWLALLAMLAMFAWIMMRVFINPALKAPMELLAFECTVSAVMAAYYGARS